MAQNFIGCDREQELLLPPSLRDWLPVEHLAWFVLDAEQLAREILAEADAIDAAEDEQFGEARGDELPGDLADPATRRQRLREAKRRLDEEWQAKHDELQAWKVAKAEYTERTGRKLGGPTKPRPVPDAPDGRINITDPDSRPVKTRRGFIQGYTAQAVATREQIVIAADVITGGNERQRLQPMIDAACHGFDVIAACAGVAPAVVTAS